MEKLTDRSPRTPPATLGIELPEAEHAFFVSLGERVVRNARSSNGRKQPRWVVVADRTAHGSTYSRALCCYFGLDPEELV
jgi:hypothetical protein